MGTTTRIGTGILLLGLATSCGLFKKKRDKDDGRGGSGTMEVGGEEEKDRIQKSFEDKSALGLSLLGEGLPDGGFIPLETLESAFVNPLRPTLCGGAKAPAEFATLSTALGGIKWGYGVRYEENQRTPMLYSEIYEGGMDDGGDFDEAGTVAADDMMNSAKAGEASLPDIARADLIGRFGDKVIFLSKRYGLFFVSLPPSGKPEVSCAVLVPGDPKNFYIHENRLYLMVNGAAPTFPAAVVRYDLGGKDLIFSGSRLLERQVILDSRRFDGSLAILSQLSMDPASTDDEKTANILSVLDLNTEGMEPSFEEIFLPEEKAMDLATLGNPTESLIGKTAGETTEFNDFLSASGRYLIVSKRTNKRVVTALREQQHRDTYCVKSEPEQRTHHYCRAIWETVENPKFDPNFSCNDAATFESCVESNKEKFVRSYSVYKGKECGSHTYTVQVCREHETKTWTTIHPVTEDRSHTDMIVYRFEDGTFYKTGGEGDAPLRQEGWALEHKSFQFRGDYLYVATTRGLSAPTWRDSFNGDVVTTKVGAYLLGENIFTKAGEVDGLGKGMHVTAVLFSGDSVFLEMNRIQYPYYPYGGNKGGPLLALDLSVPNAPRLVGEVDSSGYSEQLIPFGDLLVGIGQTPEEGRKRISHARSVLYDVQDLETLSEINQVKYAEGMERSQNGVGTDDQVYHLDAENGRLVMPVAGQGKVPNEYDGFVCSETLWISQNYLTLTKVDGAGLVREAELATNQKVERSLALSDASIVAFSDSAVYHAENIGDGWTMGVVKEEFVSESLYIDPSLPSGWIVARQAIRNGFRLKRLRFALGTKEQIEANQAQHVAEVPENMIGCLGEPDQVTFHDDQVLVRFRQYITKGDESVKANIEYRGNLAWHITADGFVRLPDEAAGALASEVRKSCYIVAGLPEEATADTVKAIVTGLGAEDLRCWSPGDPVDFYPSGRIL